MLRMDSFYLHLLMLTVFQEDISKLRRKIEKAKKPAEKISNGDDILNEEINDYKVGFCEPQYIEYFLSSLILFQESQGAESVTEQQHGCWLGFKTHPHVLNGSLRCL